MKKPLILAVTLAALTLVSCGSPFLSYEAPQKPGSDPVVPDDNTGSGDSPTNTYFLATQVFDCQRSVAGTTFTARSLKAPYDDSATGLTTIDFTGGKYLTLDLTTDGDTLTVDSTLYGTTYRKIALTLRNANGSVNHVVSPAGIIQYLGGEGFVYVSKRRDFGYFFAKNPQVNGATVAYTYNVAEVSLKSQLSAGW